MSENEKETERSDETRKSSVSRKDGVKKKKKKKIEPTYVIIGVLAAVLIGVLAYFLLPGEDPQLAAPLPTPPSERPITGGRGTLLTVDNIEEVSDILSQPIEDAQYTVSMTREWIFDTARTPSRTASVDNLERNSRMVYFDLILSDTGELVYTSPYIPLGVTHDNFALDADLARGEYDATVTFFLVDDDFEVITDVSVTVQLTING